MTVITVRRYLPALLAIAVLAIAIFHPDPVFASEGSGGGLPYESWLESSEIVSQDRSRSLSGFSASSRRAPCSSSVEN